jgi:RNA polymerase sigma-70 factor (ECF subfamily)
MSYQEDEAILLRRAREGSPDALGTLLDGCRGELRRMIRRRIGRALRLRLESSDILQATMIRAFRHIRQFDGGGREQLMAWLVRIAQNAIRDEADFARRKRRDLALTMPLTTEPDTLPARYRSQLVHLILEEDTLRLRLAMASLDPLQREVIRLRRYEELSFQEIGGRLGRSPDACRMLLARAMKALAEKMRHVPASSSLRAAESR